MSSIPSKDSLPFRWERDGLPGKWRLTTSDMGDGLVAGYDHIAGYYEGRLIDEVERLRAVPKEPPPGLLMSMALRFDHGLGCPGYYDTLSGIGLGEGGVTHAMRLESTLRTMRQLWEEVSGNGFYSPERAEQYVEMERTSLRQGPETGANDASNQG